MTTWYNRIRAQHPVILYSTLIHFVWCLLLCGERDKISTITQFDLPIISNWVGTALIYGTATIMAVLYMCLDRATSRKFVGSLLLAPQQLLLVSAAGQVVIAILSQSYADGTARPWQFILADQIWVPVVALLHIQAVYSIIVRE